MGSNDLAAILQNPWNPASRLIDAYIPVSGGKMKTFPKVGAPKRLFFNKGHLLRHHALWARAQISMFFAIFFYQNSKSFPLRETLWVQCEWLSFTVAELKENKLWKSLDLIIGIWGKMNWDFGQSSLGLSSRKQCFIHERTFKEDSEQLRWERGKVEVKNNKVWLKLGNIWVWDLSMKAVCPWYGWLCKEGRSGKTGMK